MKYERERDLQQACNLFLRMNGILFIHYAAGRNWSNKTQRGGQPDLIIFHKGKVVFIELKVNSVLNIAQEKWKEKLQKAGFHMYVCYDLQSFKEILLAEKIIDNIK